MKIKHTLYGGPLDGFDVMFAEPLEEGDEFEIPVDHMIVVPTRESSQSSSLSTVKESGVSALHVFAEGELRYVSTSIK